MWHGAVNWWSDQLASLSARGDGWSNDGIAPEAAYETYPLDSITVNALLVGDPLDGRELRAWFEAEVLHGYEAFLVYADSYNDHAEAMKPSFCASSSCPR